jgi:hypothetical protein
LNEAIGIEIKYNRTFPAGKERSSILDDVKKCAAYQLGYVLWLNWEARINDEHRKMVEEQVQKCGNVKFFYLDVY